MLKNINLYIPAGSTVGIMGATGSGKSMVKYALQKDCDVIITGDIDYHTALDSIAQGLCIIDAGHFGLEKLFITYMQEYLQREVPGLSTVKSVQDEIGTVI